MGGVPGSVLPPPVAAVPPRAGLLVLGGCEEECAAEEVRRVAERSERSEAVPSVLIVA